MSRRIFIVSSKPCVKGAESKPNQPQEGLLGDNADRLGLPYEQSANALMSARGYVEYVRRHGYHFTERLAEHVSKLLYSKIPQLQCVHENQVCDLMDAHGVSLNKGATLGDMIYATNIAYATFYPDVLKDVKTCFIHANKVVNSVNGYEGVVFCRWTADAIGKAVEIDWDKFI